MSCVTILSLEHEYPCLTKQIGLYLCVRIERKRERENERERDEEK